MTKPTTPLPDEVQTARDSLQNYFDNTVHPSRPYGEYCGLMDDLQTLDAHIQSQAEQLAAKDAGIAELRAERDYQISQRWADQSVRENDHQQDRRCMAERIRELEAKCNIRS